MRRVACRPDEDVGGDAVTEAGSGQLSSASLSAAAVYVSSTPLSVISGGARAGHDMSNDTVVKNAFFSNLKKT